MEKAMKQARTAVAKPPIGATWRVDKQVESPH